MKLYTWTVAPNPRRARMFVAEKGIDLEIVEAGDPENPAILSNAFCDKFPHRRVPLLELDDGDWIGEAAAICRYLEALYPTPSLMGRNPKEIAMIEMWDRIAEWEGMMAAAEVFRNTSKAFAGRGLPGYKKEIPQIPDLAERGKARLMMFYDKLDVQLATREFITGDLFSLADITALCSIDFAGWRKLGIPEKCANVARWHAAVSVRPSASV
jgi:glutathione S-transferase